MNILSQEFEEFCEQFQNKMDEVCEAMEEMKNSLQTEKNEVQNVLRSEIASHAQAIISKILRKDVVMVNVNDEIVEEAQKIVEEIKSEFDGDKLKLNLQIRFINVDLPSPLAPTSPTCSPLRSLKEESSSICLAPNP